MSQIFLRGSALLFINILMLQIYQTWTPIDIQKKTFRTLISGKKFYFLMILYITFLIFQILWLDVWFTRNVLHFKPESFLEFMITIPWILLFQPLFLYAFQYAIAYRLSQKILISLSYVVLFNILIAYMKISVSDSKMLSLICAASGIQSIFFAMSYYYTGFIGLSILSGLIYARFLLTI